MNLEKEIINMETWDRAEGYHIFKTFDMPYTNICSDIDITAFMKHIRSNDYYFFAAFLFYVVKASNMIKEFRCRIEGDQPIIWNHIGANYTLMQDSQVMGNNYTDFIDDFDTFYRNTLADIEMAKHSGHMINKHYEPTAAVTITSIPWLNLSGFMQTVYRVSDAVPYIGIGKRFGAGDRVRISLAVQSHHAFVDGFHVAHFFKLLEIMFSEPEKYGNADVPYQVLLEDSRPFILSEKEKPIVTF